MTCKDCFHYGACSPLYRIDVEEGGICKYFKDKSKIIELPCKVGDFVYHFCEFFGVLPYFVEEIKIAFLDKDRLYISFEANAHNEYDDELLDEIDFDIEDIGKTVFLTPEEAEKALKEMNR